MKKAIVALMGLTMVIGGLGCAALSEIVTPAKIDKQAALYADAAGVVDANDFIKGYPNLDKAIRLAAAVKSAYETNHLAIEQLAQKNQLDYDLLNGVAATNLTVAREREQAIFGEQGLLPLLATTLGMGGLGGAIGLMRRKPGDWSRDEVDKALGDVETQLATKNRQLAEVVGGVKKFMDDPVNAAAVEALKTALGKQSPDTRVAVAAIKAGVVT